MEYIESEIEEVILLSNHYLSEKGVSFDKGECECIRNAVRRAIKKALLEAQIRITDLNREIVLSL